jgi:hypothetical protein
MTNFLDIMNRPDDGDRLQSPKRRVLLSKTGDT